MIQIREYNEKDKDTLINLIRLNSPAFFANEEEKDFESYLDHQKEFYFVLEVENQILACGGINLLREHNIARISWDIVHPEHHHQKLGSQLLSYRIGFLRENYPGMKIVVRTSQMSFKFYEKAGFVVDEVKEDFWAPGFHLIGMSYNSTG